MSPMTEHDFQQHTTLPALGEKVADFLAQRRIAVAGVSAARETPGNLIYRKLKTAGYQVGAVSPTAAMFDGDHCYPDLFSVPGGVDGVVIATRPAAPCSRRMDGQQPLSPGGIDDLEACLAARGCELAVAPLRIGLSSGAAFVWMRGITPTQQQQIEAFAAELWEASVPAPLV